jgi:hypothetical protein
MHQHMHASTHACIDKQHTRINTYIDDISKSSQLSAANKTVDKITESSCDLRVGFHALAVEKNKPVRFLNRQHLLLLYL